MEYESPMQQPSDDNDMNSQSEIIHIDSGDIFHADPSAIFIRQLLGAFYLLCGLVILYVALFLSPQQSGSNYIFYFVAAGVVLIIASFVYFISAWHKRSYRSFINEQGLGCSNSHNIPAHAW
ncbi:MAG: hypothetical protein IKS45_08785, partial [Thermoguttaceae bacterium]|nr:hypothetical protein [Thermoguttaceae bacterium]